MTMPRPRPGRRPVAPIREIRSVEDLPVLCTCVEAGLLLRRNPEVIAKMASAGRLKGAKQGKTWVFRRDDLVAYINGLFDGGERHASA